MKSAASRTEMPYSVSMPQIFGMAMSEGYDDGALEVLARLHVLDLTAALAFFLLADQGADVDDALALLAGDLAPSRPGWSCSGRSSFSRYSWWIALSRSSSLTPFGSPAMARLIAIFLRAPDDVLDHRSRREVLEVQHLFVAVRVGDLEEPVLVRRPSTSVSTVASMIASTAFSRRCRAS